MKALDANVVLRLLMADDEQQTPIAEREFENSVFLSLTVIIETAWVLRSKYSLSRTQTAEMLAELIDRPMVAVEAPKQLGWAVRRFAERGDIADLIHVVAARTASSFATFDRKVASASDPDSPLPIETLA